jgi:outer membrane protein OmpA-like peptidoglycan-associated protein
MKKLMLLFVFVAPLIAQAQLGGLLNKAKNKIKEKLDTKVDKEIDKTLDPPKEKTKEEENKTTGEGNKSGGAVARSPIAAYSRYDFIPGEKVLYAEDLAQDNIGELPLGWNTRGKGEVVTLENFPGKWMRMFTGSTYLFGNSKAFGENFTVEFDLIVDGTAPQGTRFFPGFKFGMFSSGVKKVTDKSLWSESEWMDKNVLSITTKPNLDQISRTELYSRESGSQAFNSGGTDFAAFSKSFFKPAHYAIQVQKSRVRVWIDGNKVFDIPEVVGTAIPFNNLVFGVSDYVFYNESNFGLYISNIKVATGVPDTRHRLLDEGKFSTTGILFDLNSATIKPESNSVLKEIGNLMKENAGLKVKIVGHTSSDGDDAVNLELSKKRAAAIKDALVKDHKIEEARLQTEGKGETQPVGDNKTKEGQAQNRRVEFIKL